MIEFKKAEGSKIKQTAFAVLLVTNVYSQTQSSTQFAEIQKYDSVTVRASNKYIPGSFLRPLIIGSNYRKEWAEPVAMPVFRIKQSGLVMDELGGGMQTKSLSFFDANKLEWVLRTVDKTAEGALPKSIKNPLTIKFTQDMISASHPYAALVVGQLAESAGIVAPKPKVFFVPDDPGLGKYRDIFANTICFLESKEPTPDKSKTEETEEILKAIIKENDHLVLQETVLKARLLDMLVADWDRHSDQWRWGVVDSNDAKYYYAIPRDRDQAFFRFNGLLPKLIRFFTMKHVNRFKEESRGLKYLNKKAWAFDKTFLNELDAECWETITKEFQANLTDSVIGRSVKKLPAEIYALSGEQLKDKLISRRNSLLKNVMKYYRFISGTVNISGTGEEELFAIDGNNGFITVKVFRYEKNKQGKKIYERKFDPKETGVLYLDGLDGNDKFYIEENVSSRISIKIDGGKGSDTYDLKGKLKTEVQDSKNETNTIAHNDNVKIRLQ